MNFDIFNTDKIHKYIYWLGDEDEYTNDDYKLDMLFYSSTNAIYNLGPTFLMLEILILISILALILKPIRIKL